MNKYDVCVIGGSSIDIVNYQKGNTCEFSFGGKGANQAIASARAGGKTCIITKVGDDEYGKRIIDNLKNNNVDTYVEIVANCKSDYAKIDIDILCNNTITRSKESIDTFSTCDIDKYLDVIKNSNFIVLQTKMPMIVTKYIIDKCYDLGKKIILTPCPPSVIAAKNTDNKQLLDKVTYITANEEESQIVFNTTSASESCKLNPNKLIATLGEKGIVYYNGDNQVRIPAIMGLNIVDTTGAGDTFCGNLAVNLANGMSLKDAIVKSQYASAYKIQIKSAQIGMPTKAQLDEFINSKQ